VIVATPQNGQKVRVADERRFAAQCWLGRRVDVLAPIEAGFVASALARVRVDEDIQLGVAHEEASTTLFERRQIDARRACISPGSKPRMIESLEDRALRPQAVGRASGLPSRSHDCWRYRRRHLSIRGDALMVSAAARDGEQCDSQATAQAHETAVIEVASSNSSSAPHHTPGQQPLARAQTKSPEVGTPGLYHYNG